MVIRLRTWGLEFGLSPFTFVEGSLTSMDAAERGFFRIPQAEILTWAPPTQRSRRVLEDCSFVDKTFGKSMLPDNLPMCISSNLF